MTSINEINIPFGLIATSAILINKDGNIVKTNEMAQKLFNFNPAINETGNWNKLLYHNSELDELFQTILNGTQYSNQMLQITVEGKPVYLGISTLPFDEYVLIQFQDNSFMLNLHHCIQSLFQDVKQIEYDIRKAVSNTNEPILRESKGVKDFATHKLKESNRVKKISAEKYQSLTEYEVLICNLISSYYSLNEISLILHKSSQSVRGAVHRITIKLGYNSSKELIMSLCS